MSLVRQMRGGKDYDSEWGTRMKGEGPIAELISARFKAACRRYGLNHARVTLDVGRFGRPPTTGDQLSLF